MCLNIVLYLITDRSKKFKTCSSTEALLRISCISRNFHYPKYSNKAAKSQRTGNEQAADKATKSRNVVNGMLIMTGVTHRSEFRHLAARSDLLHSRNRPQTLQNISKYCGEAYFPNATDWCDSY